MSYANGTTHYNLPQTLGTDKRDWFDTNQAFADVDAALYAAATGQAADAEAIVEINQKLVTDEENIASLQTLTSTHTSQISTLQTTVNAQASQIADTRQDAEDMITAYNEGAAETSSHAYAIGDYFIYNDVLYKATAAITIGDTIVPNTNCKATNVTTEISELNSDLAQKLGVDIEIASATANQTYAQQLTALQSAFTALSNSRKVRCYIIDGDTIYNVTNRGGIFNEIAIGTDSVYESTLNISSSTHKRAQTTSSGTTFIDKSNDINPHVLHLMCFY